MIRKNLSATEWQALAQNSPPLLAMWADPTTVYAAFMDGATPQVVSCPAPDGHFASLSALHPAAAWFERAIHDLWGLEAVGRIDGRPWLDHGRWPVLNPMSGRPVRHGTAPPQPEFLEALGAGVHQIAVGPVHAGIIEPGHFRFHVVGETLVRLEARLGYTHKGTLGLMLGKSPRAAARFPARLSGDSTVAHSLAFALAAEQAAGIAAPPRAVALRAAMAEIERIANHLNDWGFICNDAAFPAVHARTGVLREALLRACHVAFGHRLMMDRVLPGGVATDIAAGGLGLIADALATIEAELPALERITASHASLQDRLVTTGIIAAELAVLLNAGGVVGRASGRAVDARAVPGYPPYDELEVVPVTRAEGDVAARLAVRQGEIRESLRMLRIIADGMPEGDIMNPLPARAGEGFALVEGFRGECFCWLRLDDGGLIQAAFLRDPSWLHWPLLEAAVQGNIVADFPLINKSINGSYSGVDL